MRRAPMLSGLIGFVGGYLVAAEAVPARLRAWRDRSLSSRPTRAQQEVRDVMTALPTTVDLDTSLIEAARLMADDEVGDVIVVEPRSRRVAGIVTDRDITIRAVGAGLDPHTTTVEEIFSRDLMAVAPSDDVERAIDLMQGGHVRRIPVVDGDIAVGVISLGDLALQEDMGSTLAAISDAVADH